MAEVESFVHQVAIRLSRALNTLNPNDLLAQRVIDIAKTNTVDGFMSGKSFPGFSPSYSLSTAARSFGKFQDSFLGELYADIHIHAKQEETGHVPQPVPGITVHDSDILEPEPAREGGLTQKSKDMVRNPIAVPWLVLILYSATPSANLSNLQRLEDPFLVSTF